MRSLIICGFLFALTPFAFSQESVTLYFDEYSFPVEEKAHASTYFSVSDSTSGHHLVKEFDIDGTLKLKGPYADGDLFTRDGMFVTYHDNGKVESAMAYYANNPRGIGKYWYRNGQLKEIRIYDKTDFRVHSFYDSLGNEMVHNGEGMYTVEEKDYTGDLQLTLVGPVKNGKKDGPFTGYLPDGTVYCKEEYKDSELVKGISYDDGKEFKYTTLADMDFYNRYMKHILKNLRYPATARRMGVEGTVYVRLRIDRDHNVEKAVVIKSVSDDLDAETVKVLKDKGFKFGPYTKRGQPYYEPVYVAPLKFKLN